MVSPVKTAVQDIRRLREIASVLTSHGFQAFARSAGLERFVEVDDPELLEFEEPEELLPSEEETEVATRFRNVLEDLGPTYVKLGQVLSTRPDIMPPAFIEELQKLQDRVPPLDFETVREQIESELGGPLDEFFEEVREEPLAAASIGQVHRARTREGEPCVVKVQRPSIRDKIQSDLDILYYLARFLEATVEELELYTPTAIVEEFEEAILSELDFEHEARNIRTFGNNFADAPKVAVPEVFEELSTDRILTLEFVQGKKLSSVEGGTPRAERVLDTLLEAMYQMVIEDGFFHGDPHPGNILVDDEDTLVFIDFGLIGTLSPRQQRDLSDLILMILTGDEDGIARTLLQMGHPVGRVNLRELKSDIVRVRDKYLFSTLAEVEISEFVQETMDAAQRHQVRLNPSYARLTKAAMTIEGLMRRLNPDLDIMDKGMPYAKRLAMQRFSGQNVLKGLMNSAMGFSGFVQQVPQHLDQILMDLESGNLTVSVQNESLDRLGTSLNTLGTRLFLGMIASALAICATMILSQFDYYLYGVSVLMVAGIVLAVNAALFFWWALGWHLFGDGGGGKIKITPLLRLFQRGPDED
jgi:ubiquinone biosynthesis protein